MERHGLGVHAQNGFKLVKFRMCSNGIYAILHAGPGDCLVHTCGCHPAISRLLAMRK